MLIDKFSRWFMRTVPEFGLEYLSEMSISFGTDIGLKRAENQDRIAVMRVNANSSASPAFIIVALADGMGGMSDGAECASRTLGAFFNALIHYRKKSPEERLHVATTVANEHVNQFSSANGGATLSAVMFENTGGIYTVNVGDSRIYATKTSAPEGEITRLTIDDSLEEAVGGHGKELLQFIGMGEGLAPHVSSVLESAERIFITSDGVHFISHALLSDILVNANSPDCVVEQLLTAAKWRGSPDNASVASVFKKGIFDSLALDSEPGIEVWDPFGSLQVMWISQESLSGNEKAVLSSVYNTLSDSVIEESIDNLTPPPSNADNKKPKKTKKRSAVRRNKKNISEQSPQIEIHIEESGSNDSSDTKGKASDDS